MSKQKKIIRNNFREATFKRDDWKCRVCGRKEDVHKLDAHHITNRNLMPNGGYVKENGITLCPTCHLKAETFTTHKEPEWSEESLYKMIKSSYEEAYNEATKKYE